MSKSVGNISPLAEALDALRARRGDRSTSLAATTASRSPSPTSARGGGAARSSGSRNFCRRLARRGRRPPATTSPSATLREAFLDGARRRLQHRPGAGGAVRAGREANRRLAAGERCRARRPAREMLELLGLESLLEARRRGRTRSALRLAGGARGRARRRATSTAPTRSATSCASAAGRSATRPRAPARAAVTGP